MKVLIVCRSKNGNIAPFIKEQVESLKRLGVEIEYYFTIQNGFLGYINSRKTFLHKIKSYNPHLIHAHYGLSGLLSNLQRSVPVVTTYHGSDINDAMVFPFSRLAMFLSSHSIFVSEMTKQKAGLNSQYSLIACGVDIQLFHPTDKWLSRKELKLDPDAKLVLFAGAFNNGVKNAILANAAVALLPQVILIELKDYNREQVALLMNAVDVVVMTSFTEGSPQFIKEAMACNCPIVSVPVGDVSELINNLSGCYLADYDAMDIANKIQLALNNDKRTDGRKRILSLGLDTETIARKVLDVYMSMMKK